VAIVAVAHGQTCGLIVPHNPLSATGLATPYLLTTVPGGNPASECTQLNADARAFAQAVILNLDNGVLSVYNPLVITKGLNPPIAPFNATLPTNYVAGIWFGFNGDLLVLLDAPSPTTAAGAADTGNSQVSSLQQGACVNGGGAKYSLFGQYSHCNANSFFAQANTLIISGLIKVPAPQLYFSGPQLNTPFFCPTVRDFSVVDQDQSDNVVTKYILVTKTNATAQDTAANEAKLTQQGVAFTVISNPSDNGLVNGFLYPTLGNTALISAAAKANLTTSAIGRQTNRSCATTSKWLVTDLADPNGSKVAALGLDELQASVWQFFPVARIPALDPMVVDAAGNPDLLKLNAYRTSVNQFPVTSLSLASTRNYCNYYLKAASRIVADSIYTLGGPSPDADNANLYAFLVTRYISSWSILTCQTLTGIPVPFTSVTAPASAEHLKGFTPEQIERGNRRRGRVLDVIATGGTLSPTYDQSVAGLTFEEEPVYAGGESVAAPSTAAAATTTASYLVPLIAVSAVLGVVVVATGTTVAVQRARSKQHAKEPPHHNHTEEMATHDFRTVRSGSTGVHHIEATHPVPPAPHAGGPAYVADISGNYPIQSSTRIPNSPSSGPGR